MTYTRFFSSIPLFFLLLVCYHSLFFFNLIIIHIFSFITMWEFLRIKKFSESSINLSSNLIENNNLLTRKKICGFSYLVIFFTQLILFFSEKGNFFFLAFLIGCLIYFLYKIKIYIVNFFFLIFLYLMLPFYTLVSLTFLPYFGDLLLLILVVVISTDIGAYFSGNALGGPKILKKISPNKTVSGVLGGFLLAICSSLFFFPQDSNLIFSFIILIFLLSLCSQVGDFLESYFKRRYKLKESSNLIPGHGGLLDRIDGFLLILNVIFLLNLINFEFIFFFDV